MGLRYKIALYRKVNWYKTIYFNFKKFPFTIAKKLPVIFYGRVKFKSITGDVRIDAPIKKGMIGFGQGYEQSTVHKGIAEIVFEGTVVFKGYAQFEKDYFVYVAKGAYVQFGNMTGVGSDGKVVCTNNIIIGDYARISYGSQVMDSNFHPMINTITGEEFPITKGIIIGSYNFMANNVTVMKGTVTPDYCTVASHSLCNKDYKALGENILIGGSPAKLLKENISRDWTTEMPLLDKWMKLF